MKRILKGLLIAGLCIGLVGCENEKLYTEDGMEIINLKENAELNDINSDYIETIKSATKSMNIQSNFALVDSIKNKKNEYCISYRVGDDFKLMLFYNENNELIRLYTSGIIETNDIFSKFLETITMISTIKPTAAHQVDINHFVLDNINGVDISKEMAVSKKEKMGNLSTYLSCSYSICSLEITIN